MDVLTTSARIKARCKAQKISVKNLLEQTQINRNFIYDLEKGGQIPSAEKLERIADYLDCSVDYLLGRTTADRPHRKRIFSGGNVGETVCRPAAPHFQSPGAGNHRDPSGRMTGNHG